MLDEPTAFLDATAAAQVRAVIRERARQRLMLISSHDPELLAEADQVITVEADPASPPAAAPAQSPEVQAGVGQQQARMLQPQLPPEQQIQIEAAGPPALFPGSVTAELLFQPLQSASNKSRAGPLKPISDPAAPSPAAPHCSSDPTGWSPGPPTGAGSRQAMTSEMIELITLTADQV